MAMRSSDEVLQAIDALVVDWTDQRDERLQRRHLERVDFDAIAATGYLELIVPEHHGGHWRSLSESGPTIVDAVGRLARADPSVALVASMHPAVQVFWAASPDAPAGERSAWDDQRSEVFSSALDGHFWGTLSSEPGSGGDVYRTRAEALPVGGQPDRYALHGAKHFGSGSEIVSYMMTVAKPPGAELPLALYMDLRDEPWDGTGGLTITRRWDGVGMKATQSHAVHLDGIDGIPFAWQGSLLETGQDAFAMNVALFASVAAAVVDSAMAEAARRLGGRQLRPYEEVTWTQAQVDHWMLQQARQGLVAAMRAQSGEALRAASLHAKLGIGAVAESILTDISRAVGGGAFSASSPFASWNEDVRALGYLRPPWALAVDQLIESRSAESGGAETLSEELK